MTTPNRKYLLDSVQEIHTGIGQILADPACQDSIVQALARLQEWINWYETEEIYHCKASLMETIQQYGR